MTTILTNFGHSQCVSTLDEVINASWPTQWIDLYNEAVKNITDNNQFDCGRC
jgi:hypothetical protein